MKKNGCVISFKCNIMYFEQDKCKHFKEHELHEGCAHECSIESECKNKAAQREAMKPKTRWTSKEPIKGGWYKVNHKSKDGNSISFAFYSSFTNLWSMTRLPVDINHGMFLDECFKRSVKPIEDD